MPKGRSGNAPRLRIQTAIEELALSRFVVLVEEKGFTLGPIDRALYWTNLYYLRERVGVQVTIEFNYDDSILPYLIRTEHGQLLPDWDSFQVERRWQRGMRSLLTGVAGIPPQEVAALDPLYKLRDRTIPASYDPLLTAYSRLICDSIDVLATQPYEVLFPPPPSASGAPPTSV